MSDSDGRLQVDFRLWDVFAGEQLLGLQFTSTPENWRRVAHKISDAVYEKLTGEKGYFDTRVVFVAESGAKAQPVRRLAIMDQDGANPSYLTDGSVLVFTPRFSSNSQEITYMALRPTGSTIYLLNLETGRQETLGHFQGMVFAPRFSPDGAQVAFSVEQDGNSDIYRDGPGQPRHPAPDHRSVHRHLAVVLAGRRSDRLQLRPRRHAAALRDGRRRLAARTASPSATAATPPRSGARRRVHRLHQAERPVFHIGVMKPDGTGERMLTSSYLDEGPAWAPNGRVIVYSHQARRRRARTSGPSTSPAASRSRCPIR